MIVCLKKIFRDLERLKEFINAVLKLQEFFFDLKVKDEAGSWYIIEMQNSRN
ncbi:PD-(D/E)XK nuclease transposase family protein [Rickettsia endosymbiont of Ixodes pacificus]|uniref:hypothetical protein n=1 Tax=Rickettsia endosymbiont of Ixodes pacificus TaxID=1133329 RepID=UPI00062009A3|nr:hypothetical protein [Rickettsia endosymbiont of Ixodes pacificus]KJW02183.1 PD-(D/E)XK nuclease transposase family protein [Rickettsia endosymbiont of Ixodes pacificus]